jgi:hypothetical protein
LKDVGDWVTLYDCRAGVKSTGAVYAIE